MHDDRPRRVITSAAPIRICDNGGWTDTWFAGHGAVFNIAVTPRVEVQLAVFPRGRAAERVVIDAENFGDRYALPEDRSGWVRHPLLEASVAHMGIPDDCAVHVTVFSEAPAGASTGTSAAVTVALIAALGRLGGRALTPHETAMTAHHIEMYMLGYQSGIQDQISAAYGGICYIEMRAFPGATVVQLVPPRHVQWELERRLALVYLGASHRSTDIHASVIAALEGEGPDSPRLAPLRRAAQASRDALAGADFAALGKAMIANTEAQANLHPALVSQDALRVIEIARAHGASGWKVNGAGGAGGTVTLLAGWSSSRARAMLRAIEQELPRTKAIPITLARDGVRVWEQDAASTTHSGDAGSDRS